MADHTGMADHPSSNGDIDLRISVFRDVMKWIRLLACALSIVR